MLPTGQAAKDLQPVYAGAQQALQGQIPAIQNLYNALLQGLQTQGGVQAQNVVESAARLGVDRPMLASDVQGQLGQALALQAGQLGVQQAQDVAGARQMVGQLGAQRASSIFDLARSLQERSQTERKAGLERKQTERQYQLDRQKTERDFQIQEAAYARRQAEAAAAAAQRAATKEANLTTSQALLTIGQVWQPGKDGYVNPKQWNELRKAFMEAGYSGSAFNSEFGNLINPAHQYRDSGLPKYQGIKLKD